MDRSATPAAAARCAACGRPTEQDHLRGGLLRLAAGLAAEVALHAALVRTGLPEAATVALVAAATALLVVWVALPSVLELLHRRRPGPAPAVDLRSAPDLWRIRVTVADAPGALEGITRELAALGANIVSLHVHPLHEGARDELVVSAPAALPPHALLAAVEAGGGSSAHVWPATAMSLVDGQTRALTAAARVAADPAELPLVVAELLGATVATGTASAPLRRAAPRQDGTALRLPSPWGGLVVLVRPDEPFTPAESARAHRLAEIAEWSVARGGERPAAPRS